MSAFAIIGIVLGVLSIWFLAWCLCRAAQIGDSQFEEDARQTPAPTDKNPPEAA